MEDLTMTTRSLFDPDLDQRTPNIDVDDETFEATVRLVVPIVFGFVTVVGLVGNLLVISSETDRRHLVISPVSSTPHVTSQWSVDVTVVS